ncbi:MAG: hypothetical protein WCY25_02355 [Moheibacter sp.]
MKSYKLLCFIIIIFLLQGCTKYVTVPGGMFGETNYYFSSGFSNKLIENRNDSIAEIIYFSEQGYMISNQYTYICEFCDKIFGSQLILKKSNKKEYTYSLICSDFEDNNRKTKQIDAGNYEVFMELDCINEKGNHSRILNIGKFEIKNGERRNLNIWIELEEVTHDVIRPTIKIPKKEYRKLQKENSGRE